MKKLFKTLALVCSLALSFAAIASCAKPSPAEEEKAPTVEITSEDGATVGLDQSYKLTYKVTDAKKAETTISPEGATYSAESKTVTTETAGTYTVTVTVTNVTKTASDSITVTFEEVTDPNLYQMNVDAMVTLNNTSTNGGHTGNNVVFSKGDNGDLVVTSKSIGWVDMFHISVGTENPIDLKAKDNLTKVESIVFYVKEGADWAKIKVFTANDEVSWGDYIQPDGDDGFASGSAYFTIGESEYEGYQAWTINVAAILNANVNNHDDLLTKYAENFWGFGFQCGNEASDGSETKSFYLKPFVKLVRAEA